MSALRLDYLDASLPVPLEDEKLRRARAKGFWGRVNMSPYFADDMLAPEIRESDHAPLYHPEEDEDPDDLPWAPPRQTLRPVTGEFEPGDDEYAMEVFVGLMFDEGIPQHIFEQYL